MHHIRKTSLTYALLGIPMVWLPVALYWSETPMLSGLLLVAVAGIFGGIRTHHYWLRLLSAVAYSGVLGLVEGRPEAPYATAELCAWVALIGILMEPWVPNVWQRIRVVATSARRDRRWYASVVLVTMCGIAVRAWQLDSVPIPISDESAAALYSLDMWHGFITNPFISGWYQFPSLWFMLQAPFVGYLGKTFLAIRLLPMLLGSACVPLLVWAVRPVLPRPAALLAGLSVALLGLHVHFSRYGLNNIADSLSSIILLGLLLRYATRPSRGYAVAIGITLGVAVYGYASARMYPLIVFGIVLGLAVRNPKHTRSHIGFLVTMALASLVVAGPLFVHYVQEPDQFWATVRRNSTLLIGTDGLTDFERFADENYFTVPELVVRNILYTLQALVWGPTEGWFATTRAILAPFTAVLALLGFVRALWRRQSIVIMTTCIWLGFFCLLSIVNWPVAAGQRLLGLLAVTGLLVGVGAQAVMDLQIPRVDRRLPVIVAILIVLSGGVQSMEHYFHVFVRREASVGDPMLHRTGVAALIAQRLPERTWVDVYASDSFNYETTPVLHFAMARLDANLVYEPAPDRAMPPIVIYPAEVADRVIMDNRYSVYELLTKHGEVLLSVAVRDDATWADRIVQQTIAENQ